MFFLKVNYWKKGFFYLSCKLLNKNIFMHNCYFNFFENKFDVSYIRLKLDEKLNNCHYWEIIFKELKFLVFIYSYSLDYKHLVNFRLVVL